MDWIEFVKNHPGTPFVKKMGHKGMGSKAIIEKAMQESTSTLINWLRVSDKKIAARLH